MSARVCLIFTTWLVLVTPVAGQGGLGESPDRTPPVGAEQHGATGYLVQSEPVVTDRHPVSNSARAVSYAADASSDQANHAGSQVSAPNAARRTATRRSTEGGAKALPPMPLPPRAKRSGRTAAPATGSSSGRALVTVLSSLGIVLAVFFAFVWLTRSAAPKGMAPLSKDVLESLGRAPLLGRQQMQLIRVGNKLILLSVTATGADTLTEITDPVEVERLCGLCRQAQSGSISDTFRQVLAQASSEPTSVSRADARQPSRLRTREPHRA